MMSLSGSATEICKGRIAFIRDGASSVLEVLSKPNVDWVKAAKISADLCDDADNLNYACMVKMHGMPDECFQNHESRDSCVVIPMCAFEDLECLLGDIRCLETGYAMHPRKTVSYGYVSGLISSFADALGEVLNTVDEGGLDD